MNRKELYAKIKKFNLQKEIEICYGDNFTRVSNLQLKLVIDKYICNKKNEEAVKEKPKNPIAKLIEVLRKKHILLKSETDYINS